MMLAFPAKHDVVIVSEEEVLQEIIQHFKYKEMPDIELAQAYMTDCLPLGEPTLYQMVYRNPFTKPCSTPPMRHFMYGSISLN